MAITKKHTNAPKKEQTKIGADESMVKSTASSNGFELKWLLLLVIGIFIVAGAWYFTQAPAAPANTPAPASNASTTDLLTTPNAVALISSFDKLQALPNSYNLSFSRPIDGIDANVSLMQKGQDRVAIMTTAFNTREYYWIGNQTVSCEQLSGEAKKCAIVNDQQQLMTYGGQLNDSFPGIADAAAQKANQVKLIEVGALHFRAPPQHLTMVGRSCTDLTYSLDFSHLTPSQLSQLGMTTSDPVVTIFRNFQMEKCLDDQMGLALSSDLNYEYVDPKTGQHVPLEDKLTYQSFQTPLGSALMAPAINSNSSDLYLLVSGDNQMLSGISNCEKAPNATAHDQCLRTGAVSYGRVDICMLANDSTARDQCISIVALATDTPDECRLAGSQVGDCYANIAVSKGDVSYCKLIVDAKIEQSCMDAVAQAKNGSGGNAIIPPASNQSNQSNGLPTPGANGSTVPRAAG